MHVGVAGKTGRQQSGQYRLLIVLAASLAGWIAVSSGLGLGLPRAKGSVLAVAFAAAAAVAGIALLTVAGVQILRMAHSWVRLVLLPWIITVLVAVYSLSIALAAVYPPHPTSRNAMPPEAIPVVMTAADGVVLSAWYLPSRTGAAVVLRHGSGATSAATKAHAQVLHDAGYGVLATDARGHGDSGGHGMDFGWFGELDTRAAIDALAERAEVDPGRIGIVGLSMGGEEAIGAAGDDQRIRVVIAEGVTGRTAADKAWLADEYGAAGVVQGVLDRITYGLVDFLTPAAPPPTLKQSVRASAPVPHLLIAAGDQPDEQLVASQLSAVDPARVDVWVVAGAGHMEALHTAPADWRTRVVGFLDAALGEIGPR